MHKVVHADEPAGCRDVVGVRVPGIKKDGHMVVPMQKYKRLLAKNDKDCITKFRYFAQREHPIPKSSNTIVQETEKKRNC